MASSADGVEILGHGFFKASWILTRAPLGPARHPVAELGRNEEEVVAKRLTIDDNDSVGGVDLENTQVLDSDLLTTHVSGHLLAGQHSATTTLRGTRTTHGPVRQGLTVTGGLTAETPSLHTTGETHSPAVCPCVDVLTLLEPICADDGADVEQARRILDTELVEVAAEADAVGGKMAPLGPCHVSGLLDAGADLDGPVAVLLASLVRDDLDAVELEDGAGRALCRVGIVEGRHALFDCEGAGARRQGVGLALEGSRLGGAEDG